MTKQMKIILALIIFAIIVVASSIFIVDQRQQALILRLGQVVRMENEPGIRFKIPFLETAYFYDSRVLHINMEPQEVIANDRKRLIIDAYAKYRISDPRKYYQSVRTDSGLVTRFSPVLESSIREEVGRVALVELLSDKREEVMRRIHEEANAIAKNYGINVVDVRIMRTDLPNENSRAIFERMKTQHEKEARQTRAEGAEEALKITSTADKDRRVILAESNKQAEILRGEGDSEATRITAKAFNRDPDFYSFYRSLQAYRESVNKDDTTMILSPDSEFLRYLGDINGR